MKTIKHIAEELGVSKQAVYKRIKKEPLSTKLSTMLSTVDGRLTVSVDGENMIKQAFEQISVNQNRQPVDGATTMVDSLVDGASTMVDSNIIELLKANIEILNSQLETKDKQIQDLSQALVAAQQTAAAAQALHAGTIHHLCTDEKKSSIWSKIFKRK